MTAVLFDYPKSAAFGRVLPKNKIYEHGNPSAAVKELFIRQVEQIVWQYKLAPETVNLTPSRAAPEIQIFRIALKTGELKHDVLHCIDQAIPFPILFELKYKGKIQAIAAFKRPSDADISKWVMSDYFESDWVDPLIRADLPVALNLEALYEQMLQRLIPLKIRTGETMQALVNRAEQVKKLEREIGLMKSRIRKEKQFNRRVELSSSLRKLAGDCADLRI